MYEVPSESIAQWRTINEVQHPYAVDLICPFCRRMVGFTLIWGSTSIPTMTGSSRCPACSNNPTFVMVDIPPQGVLDPRGKLYIYPMPEIRKPIFELGYLNEINQGLGRAYLSAINVYNVGEWIATAVSCRRLLEGIAKQLLPDDKTPRGLAQQLEALPKYQDLNKPILTLADAIRKGGNLGAHFDSEKEPNAETAKLMLDLLEYFIEYLFVLPKRINDLHTAIDGVDRNQDTMS